MANTAATAGSSYGLRFNTASSTPLVFKWTFVPTEYDDAGRYEGGNFNANDHYSVGVIAVPEPSSLVLLGLAVGLLCVLRGKRF